MNKSEIQHLKKIASQLPDLYTGEDQRTQLQILGQSLIERGITKVKGEPVNPNKLYLAPIGDGVKVNHFKRLKKLCEEKGIKAAQSYIDNVINAKAELNSAHINLISNMEARRPRI